MPRWVGVPYRSPSGRVGEGGRIAEQAVDVLSDAARRHATEAADGDRADLAAHHEGAHGGAADAESFGGFLDGQYEAGFIARQGFSRVSVRRTDVAWRLCCIVSGVLYQVWD